MQRNATQTTISAPYRPSVPAYPHRPPASTTPADIGPPGWARHIRGVTIRSLIRPEGLPRRNPPPWIRADGRNPRQHQQSSTTLAVVTPVTRILTAQQYPFRGGRHTAIPAPAASDPSCGKRPPRPPATTGRRHAATPPLSSRRHCRPAGRAPWKHTTPGNAQILSGAVHTGQRRYAYPSSDTSHTGQRRHAYPSSGQPDRNTNPLFVGPLLGGHRSLVAKIGSGIPLGTEVLPGEYRPGRISPRNRESRRFTTRSLMTGPE